MSHADFAPDMKGYTGQGAFRYWCQKVLPLVYDDSLSYYEVLCKIVKYLNNVISDVANVEENVDSLYDTYIQLQNYVNEYFDNLDVQAEINSKLDEMARDGTLDSIVVPIVGTWLSTHLTPTTPTIDDTFLIEDAGADSKSVGDKTHWYRGIISSGSLSDYTNNGWYYIPTDANISDLPIEVTNIAFLHVFHSTYGYTIQRFFMWRTKYYIRSIIAGDPAVIGNWFDEKDGFMYNRGTIPNDTDANDLTATNAYGYSGNTVTNLPTNAAGALIVIGGSPSSYQLMIDRFGGLFARRIDGSWKNYVNPRVGTNDRIDAFVAAMNKKATALGMTNTTFTSATGLNTNNVSTANDMLKLCVYANSCGFSKYGVEEYTIQINGVDTPLVLNDAYDILRDDYDVIWGKTGGVLYDDGYHYTLMCVGVHKETGVKIAGVIMCAGLEEEPDYGDDRFRAMKEVFDATIAMKNGGEQPTIEYAKYAASCIIPADGNQVTVYVQQDADTEDLPASMTKVMTMIVASEIDNRYGIEYNVYEYAVESGGNLQADDRISYGDLFYDAFINSVNTAAKMIAWITGKFYYLTQHEMEIVYD